MNGSARFEAVAILSVAFLTASLSACGAPKAKPKDPASETATNIRLAESYFAAGKVNEALGILEKAAASQPGNAALLDLETRVKQQRDRDLPTLPSTIGQEKATNPFVRVTEPAVVASASRHAGRKLDDPVSVLAAVREWKNSF